MYHSQIHEEQNAKGRDHDHKAEQEPEIVLEAVILVSYFDHKRVARIVICCQIRYQLLHTNLILVNSEACNIYSFRSTVQHVKETAEV